MLVYDELGTYTFVLLYDRSCIASDPSEPSVGSILEAAGFRDKSSEAITLNLGVSSSDPRGAAIMLTLNEGEAFAECKAVPEPADSLIELQVGAAEFWEPSLFSDSHYSLSVRDALVFCIERLCCLAGFEVGFSVHLFSGHSEPHYRLWLTECVKDKQLSLGRLLHHDWLPLHALFAGHKVLNRYERPVFLNCPAWRVSTPCNDVVCVFFDNVIPSGTLRRKAEVTQVMDALKHLRGKVQLD